VADIPQRTLKQLEESIGESNRSLKKMWVRVENLEAQIKANRKNVQSAKKAKTKKLN
jgi:hypothetical protein